MRGVGRVWRVGVYGGRGEGGGGRGEGLGREEGGRLFFWVNFVLLLIIC